jgi:hypothetical protein
MSAIHGVNYGTPTLDLNFAKNKSLIDTVSGLNLVTFTRSQTAREATYVGADGLIKTAAANEPRFDHNPATGESLGLLVEEARTNYIVDSSVFTNSGFWQGNQGITISPNQITAPDNTLSGTLIQQDTSTSLHQLSKGTFGQQLIYTSSNYTISVFVKKFNTNRITLCESYHYNLNGYTKAGMVWDFSTESLARTFQWSDQGQSTIVGTSITKHSNGWYRISLTVRPGDDGNNRNVFPALVIGDSGDPSGGGRSAFVGNGVDGVYIWGFQTEIGSFPTSYIPTTSAAVTRAADVASMTGTNFSSWSSTQGVGTIFALAQGIGTPTVSGVYSLDPGLGNAANFVSVQYDTRSSQFRVYKNNTPIIDTGSISNGVFAKTCIAYSPSSHAVAKDGSILATNSTSGNFSVALAELKIGTGYNGSGRLNGTIARFTYYPTRLQDSQLQQLTK